MNEECGWFLGGNDVVVLHLFFVKKTVTVVCRKCVNTLLLYCRFKARVQYYLHIGPILLILLPSIIYSMIYYITTVVAVEPQLETRCMEKSSCLNQR
jgi:TRAP-type mannitol/chloroaromatic compound transport system permease small subunit